MPTMMMHRNWTVRTTSGHTIKFVKLKNTHVPDDPMVIELCRMQGGEFVDSAEDTFVDADEMEPKAPSAPQGKKRHDALWGLFKTMKTNQKDHRLNFNAASVPTSEFCSKELGFLVPQQELNAAWRIFSRPATEEGDD